jgi:hypothetical protein
MMGERERMLRDLAAEAHSVHGAGQLSPHERADRLEAIRREYEAWGGDVRDLAAYVGVSGGGAAKRTTRKSTAATARKKGRGR